MPPRPALPDPAGPLEPVPLEPSPLAPSPLEASPLPGAPGDDNAPGLGDRLAAIDVGSNSIHMIVVAPEADGGYRVLDREKDMVRLGKSALSKGRLSKRAVRDGVETLVKMTTLARLKGADRAVAVATSAVREAANGGEFLARVKAQTGLDVQLLSGEQEALLIHRAVREVVDLDRGRAVVIDIGGGSTEWIASVDGQPEVVESLPLGSLRLAARLVGDPPSGGELKKLRRFIADTLGDRLNGAAPAEDAPEKASAQGKDGKDKDTKGKEPKGGDRGKDPRSAVDETTVVATSGTAVCVADLADLAAGRDRSGTSKGLREVEVEELRTVIDRLRTMERKEIAALPPVGGPRADSLLAGAVVLDELVTRAGVSRFQVSDRALREGLVLEALGRPAPSAHGQTDLRRRQILRLAQKASNVFQHNQQSARLAVRLFDLTASLHGYGTREREWLEYAALLHDIGYLIHYRKHHKHSLYLITNADLGAFEPREVEIIAHVARYHRGARPKVKKHESFAALEGWQRERVTALAALLRVADALDRTHASRVEDLFCTVRKHRVILEVISPYDVEIELQTARLGSSLFERTFDRQLTLRQGLERAEG